MGNTSTVTDPLKYAKSIDEIKHKKYIIELEKILNVLNAKYISNIDNVVKDALKDECALAMNFQLKISRTYSGDDYEDFYKIVKLTNYHVHYRNGSKIPIYIYNNIFYDGKHGIEDNLKLIPKCKCVLNERQLELYNHLAKSMEY